MKSKLNQSTQDSPTQKQTANTEKTNKMVSQAQSTIQVELLNGKLVMPSEQKPFKIEKKEDRILDDPEQKLRSIKQKKQLLRKQLEEINVQEGSLKVSQVHDLRLEKSRMRLMKSELSSQDSEHLKKLVLAHRKFEKQLEEKTRKYEQRMAKLQQQHEELIKKQSIQRHNKKKQELQKSIQRMQQKRKQQHQRFQEQKRILKQQLKKRRIHEQLKEKWIQKQKQDEKQQQRIVQDLRKMKNVDFQEIKQHSRRYDQTMKAQRQSRVNIIPKNVESFYHSAFRDAILEQKDLKREEELEKKQKIIQFFQKRKAYGEQVRQNFKPSVKLSENTEPLKSPNKSLSIFETHKKGNEYMKAANLIISHNKKSETGFDNKENIRNKYKNYLAQFRSASEIKPKSNAESVLNDILNNKKLTQEDKLYKAKMLTQKLEQKNNDKHIMKSIKAKIKILQQLQN